MGWHRIATATLPFFMESLKYDFATTEKNCDSSNKTGQERLDSLAILHINSQQRCTSRQTLSN